MFIWLGGKLFNVFASITTRGFTSLYCPCFCLLAWLWTCTVFLYSCLERICATLSAAIHYYYYTSGFLCHDMVWMRAKFYSVLIKSQSFSGLVSQGYDLHKNFSLSSEVIVVTTGF